MNCTFCSVTAFNGRRFRRRPLESVIEEIEQIPQKRILLTDDNIVGYGSKDQEWAFAFFTRILEKGIRKVFFAQASILFGENAELIRLASKAGLKIVFVGMESVNAEALKSYHKGINLDRWNQHRTTELIQRIRKNGIALLGSFVVGDDHDDRSVFHATLKFVESSRIDVLQVCKLTPLPGTQLWDRMQRDGRILDQNFPEAWEDYRFTKMVFEPARMSIEEVYEGFTYLRRAYYSFWQTLKRTLSTWFDTRSLTATLLAYGFNASYRKAFRNSEHYRLYRGRNLKKEFDPAFR